jgi:hypothetical protein
VVKYGAGLAQNVGGTASTDHRPLVQVQAVLLHRLHHAAVPQVQCLPDASSVGGPVASIPSVFKVGRRKPCANQTPTRGFETHMDSPACSAGKGRHRLALYAAAPSCTSCVCASGSILPNANL